MKTYKIITLCLLINNVSFSQYFPYSLNRAHKEEDGSAGWCEAPVNVSDNRPNNCTFDNTFYMYPVFTEEFNSKSELPNNFRFHMGWNQYDDMAAIGTGISYLGNAYNNNNISTDNGIGYLTLKKETVVGGNGSTYDFTNSFLESLFTMRQGVVEAKILLPDYPMMYDAFWLYNIQEIDIFEIHDENIHKATNHTSWFDCGSYHHIRMNTHTYIDANGNTNKSDQDMHCNRNVKFGLSQNFFQSWHIYKCVWTDYQIQIYLDGTLVGHSSRYYDGPFTPSGSCHTHAAGGWIATRDKDCNYMSSAVDCTVGGWVPKWPKFWEFEWKCFKKNRVFKDMSFVQTSIPMHLIINNTLSHLAGEDPEGIKAVQLNTLKNAWSGMTDDQKRVGIDWIKVYQPVVCSAPRTMCSLADFKNITGKTNFLSGSVIDIAQGCNFTLPADDKFPMHILYNESFSVSNTDFTIEPGAYCRIEYIDCNNGFNQYQRTTPTGEKLFLTDDEIELLEKQKIAREINSDPTNINNDLSNLTQNIKSGSLLSVTDNGAIVLYPNPSDKILNISMADEDLYDLFEIEFIDNIGRSYTAPKSKEIDVSFLSPGFYQVKFKFTSGFIVVKNFIKN